MTRRTFTPLGYQSISIDHLINVPRGALWNFMGSGKTVSTLTALDLLHLSGMETRPALVLAPLRVARDTWRNEAQKWEHLSGVSISPIVGGEAERRAALKRDMSLFTINYENLPWLMDTLAGRWPFGMVVADESTRLKGFRGSQQVSKNGNQFLRKAGGARARALAQIAHTKTKRWVNLTGTPSPNGLSDLWGQTWFLDAGQRLGRTYSSFQQRWFQAIPGGDGYTQTKPLPFAQEQIQDALRDICLSINAKDWFDIREPITRNIPVQLPSKARKLYDDMEKRMFMELAGHEVEAFNAAAKTMKCLQLANGAAYVDEFGKWEEVHTAKLDALESVVEEAAGAPLMVAYHFRSDRERLLRAFPKAVDLATDEGMARFRAGRSPIGLAHPASLGHGIDGLQDVCNIMVFFSCDWNLEYRQQIIERIGQVRQIQSGFDRPVFIYNLIAQGTVDELVLARVESKREVQDILMEAMNRRK